MGLDTVEFVMHAENVFNIKISNDEASKTVTVGQFSRLCHSKLQLKHDNRIDEEQVFANLKQILHQHFGIDQQIIIRDHFFVKDLGLE